MTSPFYTVQSLLPYTDSPGDTPGYYSDATNKLYTENMIDTPLDPGPNTFIQPVAGEVPNQAIVTTENSSLKQAKIGLALGWLALAAVGIGIIVSKKSKNGF